jgi:serine/threonine protein kinase
MAEQAHSSPFLATFYKGFETAEKYYFITDHYKTEFRDQISSGLSEASVKFYASEVLLALEHLHSRGIVCGGLTPENIVLCGKGHVKLVDYGHSWQLFHCADADKKTPVSDWKAFGALLRVMWTNGDLMAPQLSDLVSTLEAGQLTCAKDVKAHEFFS